MTLERLGELYQNKRMESITNAVNFSRKMVESLPENELTEFVNLSDRICVDLYKDLLWMSLDNYDLDGFSIPKTIEHYHVDNPQYSIKMVSFVFNNKDVDVEVFLYADDLSQLYSELKSDFWKIARKIEKTALGIKMSFDLKDF